MVVETFRYYAAGPSGCSGDTIPVAGGVDMTFREPLGVVGLIVAVELPAGDRVVEGGAGARGRQRRRPQAGRADAAHARSSSSGSRREAGAARGRRSTSWSGPGGVCGHASSSTPTSRRSRSPDRPRWVAGSPRPRPATIKRVTLELGGKSANVVFADADLEQAAAARPIAVFGNAGQDCCARSRVLVERSALDRFIDALEPAVEALRVGDPLDEATEMGPLISADQRETVGSLRPRGRTGRDPRLGARRAPASGSRHRAVPGLERRPRRRARRSSGRWRA